MEEHFLRLTNTAYRIVEFFPESDPLKNRAKDKVLSIMENLTFLYGVDGWAAFSKEKVKIQLLEDIDIFLGYLWIAKAQGWVSASNYLIIHNEYKKIKREIQPYQEFTKKIPFDRPLIAERAQPVHTNAILESVLDKKKEKSDTAPDSFLLGRQKKIVEFLKENEKAQVMDLQQVLPNVTKRTIRRDLDQLLETGKIVRLGNFNQVFYQIRR